MSNPVYKKVRIAWKYPTQPTSLQVGTVRIVRSTQPFTVEDALNQTQIDYREYSPEFTFYDDGYELEEGLTYYYMIICYGDIDDTIIAATDLYSIKIETSQVEIPSPDMSLTLPPMEPKIVGDQATIEFTSPIAVRTAKWTLSYPTLADFDESTLQLTFKNVGILTVTVVVNDLLTASFDVQIKPRIVVRAPYNLQLVVSPADSESNI